MLKIRAAASPGTSCANSGTDPIDRARTRIQAPAGVPIAVVIVGAAASFSGTYYLIVERNAVSFDESRISRAINTTINIQPSAGPGPGLGPDARPETGAAGSGGPETRNVFHFNNEFKLEVMRATTEAAGAKKDFRDKVLGIIEALVSGLATGDAARARSKASEIVGGDHRGRAHLQVSARPAGSSPCGRAPAHFLPGGGQSLAVLGPYGSERPDTIYVRRDGRKVPMSIGSVRLFKTERPDMHLDAARRGAKLRGGDLPVFLQRIVERRAAAHPLRPALGYAKTR